MLWLELSWIQNVDFFEAVKNIPDKSIPIILTAPPFNDEDVPLPYYGWYDRLMGEVCRICSDYAIIFSRSYRLSTVVRRYRVGKGQFKDDKNVANPSVSSEDTGPFRILMWTKDDYQYSYNWQPIIIYRFTDEWNINERIRSDHLSQPPYFKKIIKMFPKDKLILEPFAGSGTTPLICNDLGRRWIAYEIDPEKCRAANRRLRLQYARLAVHSSTYMRTSNEVQ